MSELDGRNRKVLVWTGLGMNLPPPIHLYIFFCYVSLVIFNIPLQILHVPSLCIMNAVTCFGRIGERRRKLKEPIWTARTGRMTEISSCNRIEKQKAIFYLHSTFCFRRIIVETNIKWPNGLAIDRIEGRIYWNDAKILTIESSNFNGDDRRTIRKSVPYPYGIVVVGAHIYWTDWKTQSLNRADKITGNNSIEIRKNLEGLMDIRAVQVSR